MVTGEIPRKLCARWRSRIVGLPFGDGRWRYSRFFLPHDPPQGWKIHVSATLLSASQVLARVHPILKGHDALFKVPSDLGLLREINTGLRQFSQVGKFLTVYPRSEAEAVELARELHRATHDLRGPVIPFDKRYSRNSLVYYRYGAFRAARKGIPQSGLIFDSAGRSHTDNRASGCAIPRWLNDPFQNAPADSRRSLGPIGADYLPFKAIIQRGKGGVYEAVDLTVSPARLVIIKEGRRHGETDWNGQDGYEYVKNEARVLRALRKAGSPVPNVWHEFDQNGNRYLVLEKIPGCPLLASKRAHPPKPSWRRAQKILQQAAQLLSLIHAAGWVWRDCKPSHIFMHRGTMRLIDFEGACRLGETRALPWSSPNYALPNRRLKFSRRPGILEDEYALGVIAFQFGTGSFPPSGMKQREVFYRRTSCPDESRRQINRLLGSRPAVATQP